MADGSACHHRAVAAAEGNIARMRKCARIIFPVFAKNIFQVFAKIIYYLSPRFAKL